MRDDSSQLIFKALEARCYLPCNRYDVIRPSRFLGGGILE